MKLSRILLTTLGVLLLACGAFAQEKGSLNLAEKTTVQGKELQPGKYKVQWTGESNNVQVTLKKGNETITVPATVVPSNNANAIESFETHKDSNGEKQLVRIYPAGKKYNLELTGTATASTN